MRAAAALLALIAGCTGIVVPGAARAEEGRFYGMLRERDLSPFGFLRLDMRPAHAVSIEPHSFAIEMELGYQNTWALSPNVEKFLTTRESAGRHDLGPADIGARIHIATHGRSVNELLSDYAVGNGCREN